MAKKNEYWLSEEGLLRVRGWARDGLTDLQIADQMGIAKSTLYDWKKKFSDFSDALKESKEVADRNVENKLYEKAMAGDMTAIIFWLKNRKQFDWRDRRETQINATVQNVPDRLVIDYGDDSED